MAEQVTLIDLYNQYASGQLDNSEAIPAEFATSKPVLLDVTSVRW